MSNDTRSLAELSDLANQLIGSTLAVEMVLRGVANASIHEPKFKAYLDTHIAFERDLIESALSESVVNEFRKSLARIIRPDRLKD